MSDATRKQAIVKLEAFLNKIGYPDKWRDYSALHVDRSSYQTNRFRVSKFNEDRDWAKIGKPVDRMEWGMTPPTVNAYYNPQNNEIVFPAGILQPPYFDPNADDALNYGGMGSVIGHEMTHGFDDQGAKYDPSGNLANWWSDADLKAFKERAGCIVNQFNGFEVEKGLNENGSLVQGESIADLGGLVVAYAAFQKAMEGKPRRRTSMALLLSNGSFWAMLAAGPPTCGRRLRACWCCRIRIRCRSSASTDRCQTCRSSPQRFNVKTATRW